ncbi:MAG: hypothetical protein IKT50_02690 [Clostridia bacterium]|nr:hypothetical protein [Clostridia bacterium]
MAKDGKIRSLSHFLYEVGGKILFQPAETFATAGKEAQDSGAEYKPSRFQSQKLKIKNALAKAKEQSFFAEQVDRFVQKLFTTRIRSFGVLFFSCGFLQILSYFLGSAISFFPGEVDNLLFGVCLVFLTIFCSFSRGDLSDAVRHSFFFRKIVHSVFGVEEWALPSGRSGDHIWSMLLFGVILAFFSVLFSPTGVLLLLAAVLCSAFVLYKPEAGLVLSVMSLILFDFSLLLYPLVLTLFSFLFKCALGKRSLLFSWGDLVALGAVLPFSVVGDDGTWYTGFSLFCLYYLTRCMIRRTRQLENLLTAVMYVMFCASAVLCLREAIVRFAPEMLYRFPKAAVFLRFLPDEQTGSVFAVLCPLVLGLSGSATLRGKKMLCLITFLGMTAGIAFTGSYGIWLGYFLALAVQFLFSYRSSLILLVAGGLSFASAIHIVPVERLRSFFAVFGFGTSAKTFSESAVGGLFSTVSHTFGGIGIVLILCLMVRFLFEVFRFKFFVTKAEVFPMILGVLTSAVCFFALGYQEIAFSPRLPALFILLSALPQAAYRASLREETRLPY